MSSPSTFAVRLRKRCDAERSYSPGILLWRTVATVAHHQIHQAVHRLDRQGATSLPSSCAWSAPALQPDSRSPSSGSASSLSAMNRLDDVATITALAHVLHR